MTERIRRSVEKHQLLRFETTIDVRLPDGEVALWSREHRDCYRTLGMLVESIRKMPVLLAQAAAKDDHWQLALPEALQGVREIVIALNGAQLVLR